MAKRKNDRPQEPGDEAGINEPVTMTITEEGEADPDLGMMAIPEPKRLSGIDLIQKFVLDADRHPDIKLLSVQNGGAPRPNELFPDTAGSKQRIYNIRLVYRDVE